MPTILNPTPTQGTGTPFGSVPGNLGLPDPFGDLSKVAPGLGGVNQNLLTNLTANSLGIVSPGTRNALQLTNAQNATRSGMGISGLSDQALFGNIADYSNKLQQQAVQDYNTLIPTLSRTQTVDPALQTEIANTNAIRGAAPSPTAAANYAKMLFDEYAAKVRGPGGGYTITGSPAGGTRTPAAPSPGADASFWGGGGTMVGGPGAGTTGTTPAPFDWFASTFGRPAAGGAAPARGPGNTFIGNPMFADEFGDSFAAPFGTVGASGLPGTEGEPAPDLGGGGDILSELYMV